jgi:uncharacterized membrane protein
MVTEKASVSRVRHFAKAITWRITASTETFFLGWIITGDPKIGISISIVEFFSKTILYYLHERAWYRLSDFGVKKEPEQHMAENTAVSFPPDKASFTPDQAGAQLHDNGQGPQRTS